MLWRKHDKVYSIFNTNKNELANSQAVTNKMKFIDSMKFIKSSLSSLADNLAESFQNSKCKDYKSCLEYIKAKDKSLT